MVPSAPFALNVRGERAEWDDEIAFSFVVSPADRRALLCARFGSGSPTCDALYLALTEKSVAPSGCCGDS